MEKTDFIKALMDYKQPVWDIIQTYLPKKEPYEHYTIVREYPERQGKYFRPGLLLLAAEMFGLKTKIALPLAAVVQLSEEWLLIHDDVEDQSLERRSTPTKFKPTLHKLYGNELAINAGDALHVLMWKALGDLVEMLNKTTGRRLYQQMQNCLLTTIEGQFIDLNWIQKKQLDISEKDYYEMITKKTCSYTTNNPIKMAAILAGKTDKELLAIENWTIPFGYAFQIWDDIINLTEKSNIQGKEQAGDILEGKRTLILIHLLKHCKEVEKKKIKTIYCKKREEKTEEEKLYVLSLMQQYGSIHYAQKTAKKHAKNALKHFDIYTKNIPNSQAKTLLLSAIEFVVERKR